MSDPQNRQRVLVLGLGETGNPLLQILQESYEVYGSDLMPGEVPKPIDVMHICYPFTSKEGFAKTTIDYIAEYDPGLVIINSTVLPGTTTSVARATSRKIVFSPIRGKHTQMRQELLKYVKFIAGSCEDANAQAREHFERAGFKVGNMSQPEALELAKLFETSYLGLLVGWAQEMDRYAKKLDVDYYETLKFLEEIEYLPPYIFHPGFIGGHCVMPNLELLSRVMAGEFVTAIQKSNSLTAAESEQGVGTKAQRLKPTRIRD